MPQNSTTDFGVVLEGNFEKLFSGHKENSLRSVGERVHRDCTQNTELWFIF